MSVDKSEAQNLISICRISETNLIYFSAGEEFSTSDEFSKCDAFSSHHQ